MLLRPILQPTTICRPVISTSCFQISPLQAIRNITTTTARTAPYPVRTPFVRQRFLRTTLILTGTATTAHFALLSRHPTYHDSSPTTSNDFSSSAYSHSKDAKVPLSKDGGRSLNPAAIKQISYGGILGLGLGILVSAFSKMLVLVIGLGIVATQMAARRGINVLPIERVQRYVKRVDLRSAINDNVAFKISFGLLFALTAFGEL